MTRNSGFINLTYGILAGAAGYHAMYGVMIMLMVACALHMAYRGYLGI